MYLPHLTIWKIYHMLMEKKEKDFRLYQKIIRELYKKLKREELKQKSEIINNLLKCHNLSLINNNLLNNLLILLLNPKRVVN